MERVVLDEKDRKNFFKKLFKKSKLTKLLLARRYGISARTLRDWERGKFKPSLKVVSAMARDFEVSLPKFKAVSRYWYISSEKSRKAALRRVEIHGPPGNLEGRRKGGVVSQKNRRKNPQKYKKMGCVVAKEFADIRPSEKLAELFGIILGDGSISNTQLKITLSRFSDKEYSLFVFNLIKSQLKESPSLIERESTVELYLSGVNLVKKLEKKGLRRGNKIVAQVRVPQWIMKNKRYKRACLRGLFDTDGGLYIHKHGRWNNLGWCFTSHSLPLIDDVKKILLSINVKPRGNKRRVYLYAVPEIRKFMDNIGSSNPKNNRKYDYYMKRFYNYEWKKFARNTR